MFRWNYKGQDPNVVHIAPIAQDFHELFGLDGPSDKMISGIDPAGVALVGVKALSQKVAAQQKLIDARSAKFANPAWSNPEQLNSWVYFGAPFNPAGYYIDAMHVVHLRGVVKSGTCGAAIFTLPISYRPTNQELMRAVSAGGNARVDILTTGDVLPDAAMCNNGWFSLDGITFRAN
jgi:hypothetical protein